ncbi:hypothetical protein V8F33_000065 [Rhypophila sp. PSN 637]
MTSQSEPTTGAGTGTTTGTDSRHKIRIGVFVPFGCQLLDLACVDVFGTMSYEYQSPLTDFIPKPIVNLAPSVDIYYIGSVHPGELIELTSAMNIRCTHHMSSPEVQPGKLDIVMIPGPDPSIAVTDEVKKWVAGHFAVPTTDILSICTGAFICGEAGILKGKKFCGPRAGQDVLQAKFGDQGVDWQGGITNGNDLVAAYARHQTHHFPGPLAEFGIMMTEVGDRPQQYTKSQASVTIGVVWQIIKAVFMGFGSKSKSKPS